MNRGVAGILLAWILLPGSVWPVLAADEVVNEHVAMYTTALQGEWEQGLREKGLQKGANERDIYVASGRAIVNFPLDHPGFLESRSAAFDVAYLRAKANMVEFLGASVEQKNSYEFLENARWSEGQGEALTRLKKAGRISEKLADLAEAQLDQQLTQIKPDYDPDKYGSREEKEKAFRSAFKRQIRLVAASLVSGALPLEVLEGPENDGSSYHILVGLVWSPRLERAARAVAGGYVPANAGRSGVRVVDWLPKTKDSIVASWGVHKLIDENGEQVFIGFGQAAPRLGSPSRRSRAKEAALRLAELRAKGSIRGFVGEVVRSEKSEDGEEIAIEYVDTATSGAVGREFAEKLESSAKAITLTGLTTVGRWVVPHPVNDGTVAVVAVSWSPKGLATAKRVTEAMRNPGKTRTTKTGSEQPKPGAKLLRKENIAVQDL